MDPASRMMEVMQFYDGNIFFLTQVDHGNAIGPVESQKLFGPRHPLFILHPVYQGKRSVAGIFIIRWFFECDLFPGGFGKNEFLGNGIAGAFTFHCS